MCGAPARPTHSEPATVDSVPAISATHGDGHDAKAMASPSTGSSFPGYEILEELGRGGMGVVYKARQLSLNRLVAIKVILAGGNATYHDLARFFHEAEAMAQIQHANIVQVFEVQRDQRQPFFVTEFIAGSTLSRQLAGQPQPPRDAARLIAVLARAMHFAHAHGIIHRDLKPSNVLLTLAGDPKIADFGLAKRLEGGPGLTQTGAIVGTPSYMAPEQASGVTKHIGPAADVYALGATLYEMLTGRPPFQTPIPLETVLLVLTSEPVAPRKLLPTIPRDLETICLKCLEKKPADRYASAAELAQDLERFLEGKPLVARPVGPLERGWRWCKRKPALASFVGAATLALLASVGLIVGLYYQRDLEAAMHEAQHQKGIAEGALQQEEKLRQQAQEQAEELAKQKTLAEKLKEIADARARELDDYQRALKYANEMRLLHDLWALGNASAVKKNIGRVATEFRSELGFEFFQLWQEVHAVQKTANHEKSVNGVAFAPDGKTVASAGADNTIRFWDPATGNEAKKAWQVDQPVQHLAWSRDGKHVVFTLHDGTARIWSVEAEKELRSIQMKTKNVVSMALAPNGLTLATASRQGNQFFVEVWQVTSGAAVQFWEIDDYVRCLAYSASSDSLAVVGTYVKVFDVRHGALRHDFHFHDSAASAVAYSPAHDILSVGNWEGIFSSWQVASGRPLPSRTPGKSVSALAYSPDGAVLAIGSTDNTITLLGRTGHKSLFVGHTNSVAGLAFSPDGAILVSGGSDGKVKFWDVSRTSSTFAGLNAPVASLAFSLTSKALYSGGRKRDEPAEIIAWNPLALDQKRSFSGNAGHADDVEALAITPDDKVLVSASRDGAIRLWDRNKGEVLGSMLGHKDRVTCLALSPDGRYLASGDGHVQRREPGELLLWDFPNRAVLARVAIPAPGAFAVAYLPDGRTLAVGIGAKLGVGIGAKAGQVGSLRFCSPVSGSTLWTLPNITEATCLSVSRSGVVAIGDNINIRLYDTATRRMIHHLVGHTEKVMSLAFSPDGKTVASCAKDRTLRLWHARTGLEIVRQPFPMAFDSRLAFSPDGALLVGAGQEGSTKGCLHVWRAASRGEVEAALQKR